MLYSPQQFAVRSDDDERVTGLDGAISYYRRICFIIM